jgi:Family of unknown function (DUF6941)
VSKIQTKFRNAILCEDIRDEVGNKKSLMGTISGDVLVREFPVTLRLAIYMEYVPEASDGDHLSVEFRLLQNETEIAKGKMESSVQPGLVSNFVLPMAFVTFEKEATFRMCASVNNGPEEEILSKKVMIPTGAGRAGALLLSPP